MKAAVMKKLVLMIRVLLPRIMWSGKHCHFIESSEDALPGKKIDSAC